MLQQRFRFLSLIALLFITIQSLSSCNFDNSYQDQKSIPEGKWNYNFQPEFEFEIKDPSVRHKVSLVIRHDEGYEFANIWVRLSLKYPYEKNYKPGTRIEAFLADNEGNWQGKKSGSVIEDVFILREGVDFPKLEKAGTYSIKLEQVMRQNPLISILNVGIRVEEMK